jgi:phenylacetate-CoA ligase
VISPGTARPSLPATFEDHRQALRERQMTRLAHLLTLLDGRNAFYTHKLRDAGVVPASLELPRQLERIPFTTKTELVADQARHAPWGSALTEPPEAYTRFHQTSSTTGPPLKWLDTNASWQWTLDCWKAVYEAARVTAADRIFFPFSFGPFLGFWTAFEAGCQIGAHCIPGGGMSSEQRLAMIDAVSPTVLCCTPTYALRLAEVARADASRPSLRDSAVRTIIVAGEPGGSLAAVRRRIEAEWQVRVIDHYGLTEVGPVAFECWEVPGGLHVNEEEYIAELIGPEGRAVEPGAAGELVLTNLGRLASPVLRYRTGDLVRSSIEPCPCGRPYLRLVEGVIGRTDDMVTVRGVNIYPNAVEAIVRAHLAVEEFRATVQQEGALRSLSLEIELAPGSSPDVRTSVSRALRHALGLEVPVIIVEPGTLPRFTMKARRLVIRADPDAEGTARGATGRAADSGA